MAIQPWQNNKETNNMSDEDYEKLQKIGKCAADCIVEMVRALDQQTYTEDFVEGMKDEEVTKFAEDEEILTGEEMGDMPIEDIREKVVDAIVDGAVSDPEGYDFDEDVARDRIMEDPLSVQVRSGWVDMGAEMEPEEYCILLGTGGPATRIIGDLDGGEPSSATLQAQDWGTPWTDIHNVEHETLLTYVRQFCFES